jgi:hypothetical protein
MRVPPEKSIFSFWKEKLQRSENTLKPLRAGCQAIKMIFFKKNRTAAELFRRAGIL